jgi:hypothetical protein
MPVFLAHGDFAWVLGGLVVFTGLMVLFIKIARGRILSTVLSCIVWYFVYKLHGGSNTGIMTATLAALLFDLIGLPILKLFARR